MVVYTDERNEVVFLIEHTSIVALHFPKLQPYIDRIIEYFNKGPIVKDEFPGSHGDTSYCMLSYGTAKAWPGSGIFNKFCSKSSSVFSKTIASIKLDGSGGENHTLLAEGLATVLDVFDYLACDHYENCKINKYCILIAFFPPYDLRSTEGNLYCDLTVDELALKMAQLGVNLSVISPVKRPIFQNLFDKASSNLVKSKSFPPKDFVKDKNQLVWLRGIDLLTPLDPQPEIVTTPPDQSIKRIATKITAEADEPSAPAVGIVQPRTTPTTTQLVEPPTSGLAPQGGSNLAWTGFLEWHETIRSENNGPLTRVTRSLACHVSTPPGDNLYTKNWPEKLIMQLIPQTLLTSLGTLLHNSRTVGFHFAANDPDSLRALYRVMATSVRFAGCVHFVNTNNCDVRILLLIFSPRKRAFVGLIPNDQVLHPTVWKSFPIIKRSL